MEEVEPRVCDVALCVAEGPDNGVHQQLELLLAHGEQGGEAVGGDGTEQVEELEAVFGVVLVWRGWEGYSEHGCGVRSRPLKNGHCNGSAVLPVCLTRVRVHHSHLHLFHPPSHTLMHTSKFLVIICSVQSKTASKMRGTSASMSPLSLLMMAANMLRTSASLQAQWGRVEGPGCVCGWVDGWWVSGWCASGAESPGDAWMQSWLRNINYLCILGHPATSPPHLASGTFLL